MPEPVRRARARTRAELSTRPAAVSAFRTAHGAALPAGLDPQGPPW